MKKTIYTLSVDGYAPDIVALTFPLMALYAAKIQADLFIIKERQFPDWPVTYEKLQIFELAKAHGNDWSIFFDADTLISPEYFDPTNYIAKDTVAHNGRDPAGIRWTFDEYFRRDGRNFGSCNWHTMASDWCLDLWRPLDDISMAQALANIHVTIEEMNSGHCNTDHLIDDYVLSRNIARFGLKATTVCELCAGMGWRNVQTGGGYNPHLWHKYTIGHDQKISEMLAVLTTPKGQPAFAEPCEIVNNTDGNMRRTRDGRMIGPCGQGWGLMSQDQLAKFTQKYGAGTRSFVEVA